jgi:hypothetical protein
MDLALYGYGFGCKGWRVANGPPLGIRYQQRDHTAVGWGLFCFLSACFLPLPCVCFALPDLRVSRSFAALSTSAPHLQLGCRTSSMHLGVEVLCWPAGLVFLTA